MTVPTPHEIRQGIADKLAQMPGNVDHNGHHDADRAADAAPIARATAPEPDADPGPHAMRPNPAQGHSGAAVPTPAPTDPLAAIRAQTAKLVR